MHQKKGHFYRQCVSVLKFNSFLYSFKAKNYSISSQQILKVVTFGWYMNNLSFGSLPPLCRMQIFQYCHFN